MDQNTCVGILGNGAKCTKTTLVPNTNRCTVHYKVFLERGPHATARYELSLKLKREQNDVWGDVNMHPQANELMVELRREQRNIMKELEQQQAIERENVYNGVDPDEEYRVRHEQRLAVKRQQRMDQQHQHLLHMQALHNAQVAAAAQNNTERPRMTLKKFVGNNQNVHFEETVKMVEDTIKKLFKIKVDKEYQWDERNQICSKTPGDIILDCGLSLNAARHMMNLYCENINIYNLGSGVYAKSLDAVWQFSKQSEDKASICKIIKTELEDCVGMCPQGNLTRVCNILNGYLYDFNTSKKSINEELSESLSLLMQISDENERVKLAQQQLEELKVPLNQWIAWVEPLVNEGTVEFDGSTSSNRLIISKN
jgi:hypothetical protein